MRGLLALITLSVLAGTLPAWADIYVWRDQYGVSHYTTDLATVPIEFRSTAITVAKDWVRAEPPPEPKAVNEEPPPPSPRPSASAGIGDRGVSPDLFDAGYAEGLRAAQVPSSVAVASSSSPVFQIMSQEPPPRERLLPVFAPVIIGRGGPAPRNPSKDDDSDDRPRSFAGAAGPPPLGAPGPPPFQPFVR